MPRKFRRFKPISAPHDTVYLEHPVGSNEWHRQKLIKMNQQRVDEEKKQKELRENPPNKEQNRRKLTRRN